MMYISRCAIVARSLAFNSEINDVAGLVSRRFSCQMSVKEMVK